MFICTVKHITCNSSKSFFTIKIETHKITFMKGIMFFFIGSHGLLILF